MAGRSTIKLFSGASSSSDVTDNGGEETRTRTVSGAGRASTGQLRAPDVLGGKPATCQAPGQVTEGGGGERERRG